MTCAESRVMENVKEQLDVYMERQKDIGKTYTQEDVSNLIGSSYQRFRNCLNGRCAFNIDEICALAALFDVSTDKLMNGYKEENRKIVNQLGLTDEAISYLESVKGREDDCQESFITTAEVMSNNANALTVPLDKPIIEGGTTDEILFIINWLLSHDSGHNLLSMIAKYCLIDGSQGWIFDCSADIDDPFPFTECDELYFKNRIGEGWKMVNPGILRYALIPAITDEVNRIREEITREGAKNNGKKKGNHEKTSKQ